MDESKENFNFNWTEDRKRETKDDLVLEMGEMEMILESLYTIYVRDGEEGNEKEVWWRER